MGDNSSKMDLKQALGEKWYIQGFIASPLLVMSAALSGFSMKKLLGMSYSHFIFTFEKNYCKMHYLIKDLDSLSDNILYKMKRNKRYLYEVRKLYDKGIIQNNRFYLSIKNKNLKKINDSCLYDLVIKSIDTVERSVGVGHIIESFSLTMDYKIKKQLSECMDDLEDFNKRFSILMSPVEKSFINEAEELLSKINQHNKKDLLKKYISKFGWIRNSYAGKYALDEKDLLEEGKSYKNKEKSDFAIIRKEKNKLIEKLQLKKEIIDLIKATEFLTSWQDERKKNILISIDQIELLLEELSLRSKIGKDLLRYATRYEINGSLINLKDVFKQRKKGALYFCTKKRIEILTGGEYKKSIKEMEKEEETEVRELTGITASAGTAIGPVKLCLSIASINHVKKGDIIVASMTRPEYAPAMKKAAAIITDEGGITCHAAIVSRELGIPCIIGTKKATKVLKNGDLVEVKGNHGLLIILKRA